MSIIAVANQKGGVAKTTTSITLAHGAALRGQRVLLVDLDPQGNCADALGLPSANSLQQWLIGGCPIDSVATLARPNLWVIRSDKSTSVLKMVMAGMDFREQILSNALEDYSSLFDLVILDCPPSADILQISALVAADFLLIPIRLEQFAIKGIQEILSSLASVQRVSRSSCRLAGILPTFFDWTTKESYLQMTGLTSQAALAPFLWPVIPLDTRCREANRLGKTLWEITPKPAALIGRNDDGKSIGGYQLGLARLMTMI